MQVTASVMCVGTRVAFPSPVTATTKYDNNVLINIERCSKEMAPAFFHNDKSDYGAGKNTDTTGPQPVVITSCQLYILTHHHVLIFGVKFRQMHEMQLVQPHPAFHLRSPCAARAVRRASAQSHLTGPQNPTHGVSASHTALDCIRKHMIDNVRLKSWRVTHPL